jgi:hypothetical protein
MIGEVQNAVLQGDDWKQITLNNGSGVIVSVDTPVAGILDSGDLWYVVQATTEIIILQPSMLLSLK